MSLRSLTILIVFLFLITSFPAGAQVIRVEEISNYRLSYDVESKHVVCEITIKNLIKNPLVPGVGELRLQKQGPMKIGILSIPFTNKAEAVNVSNLKAYAGRDIIKANVIYEENYTVIQYELWRPIKGGESYTFTLEFDADLVDEGILFKSITIPVGADVDIRNAEIKISSAGHLTYSEPKMENGAWKAQIPANSIAFFTAEFSAIPMPQLPVKGYIVFWLLVMAVLASISIIAVLRKESGEND